MPSWWTTSTPEVLVAPDDVFGPGSIHAPRFVSRELVQPSEDGRLMWSQLADVLATTADITALSLYETTADDVTAIHGASVHCYFTGEGEALVESVDAEGWRSFGFIPESEVVAQLIETLASERPSDSDRWLGCVMPDSRDGVILTDGTNLVLGDLPANYGPVREAVRVTSEDVLSLLLARLRVPVVA